MANNNYNNGGVLREPSPKAVLVSHFDQQEEIVKNETDKLFALLDDLDVTIRKKSSEKKIYGNIYSAKGLQQVKSYMKAVKEFAKSHPVRTICEIGFAGGHSASVFLFSTKTAQYTAFDMWDRAEYEDAALAWVRKTFQGRDINLVKGDSTKTVPQYQGTCDVIHIDGAHHANFPLLDMKNMARLASKDNLLLMDDCSKSWPAVLKGVDYLKKNGLVSYLDMIVAENWVFRGAVKGWCIGSYKKSDDQKERSIENAMKNSNVPKSFTFLGKSFCNPFWTGSNCDQFVNKKCSPLSDECFYNDVYGTVSVSCERWHGAQRVEQVTWDTRKTATDRNEAHAESYDNYKSLPNDLGDVIELGAGPFTQSQTILQSKKANSITLVEPMAFHYINHVQKCFYKNGDFNGLPTTLLSMPAEEINNGTMFDTLVMINVIEHVYDGLSILNSAINLIKDGGLFIWHERIWDAYRGKANSPEDREFKLHPIRIKSVIAKQVMSAFDEIYVTWDTAELRRLKNQGVYFIGRKRSGKQVTDIPQHPPCFERTSGSQDVVIFVSNMNYTLVTDNLKIAETSSNVKAVILVLTEPMNPDAMSELFKFKKIRITVSYQHMGRWQAEVSRYTKPCASIQPRLTPDLLQNSETVCVGNNDVTLEVTVVLMGYSTKRFRNYDTILPSYTKMGTIKKIVFVWNNKNTSFPISKFNTSKITFVSPDVNSMNNRFDVFQHVTTDAVLLIDDDVVISEPLLKSMLLKWNENVDRLIGVVPDMRYVSENDDYKVTGSDPVIAIGKTMLFHRKYLQQYMQDKDLVEWNKDKFCEDVSMNGLIRKATGLKPVFVKQSGSSKRQNLPETEGLSITRPGWGGKRTECVKYVSKHFGIHF